MREVDLTAALALSQETYWPHRSSDWRAFLELGEGRVIQQAGTILGAGMRWTWGEAAASIGVVIISEARRHQGLGRWLMESLMQDMGSRALLLHATPEGLPLYEKLGYSPIGTVDQHQGKARQAPLVALPSGWRLRPAGRSELSVLAALDASARGMQRERLIAFCLTEATATVVLDDGQRARGFAVLRRFGRGLLIGPVVAPERQLAQALIGHLAESAAGRFLRIDIEHDPELGAWLASFGLLRTGQTTTMVRGVLPPAHDQLHSYALVAQALG